eukprot:CAMPEP_0172305842 /NCGR_PEP_ID=MMETSP1058-20130122/7056_1 /TAXON_ID=83371 /ORGANISM="Detonula confervacea, Strain CCMP 353" /LENGTH=262 /DNA_ID=CAMNT_0013017563 /DNA_START=221 /DNA_END=1009 /DNA_ORIENTATION=+
MSHVEDVMASLDFLLGTQTEPSPTSKFSTNDISVNMAIITLAAFFHDVIYNPKSPTNEKDSAVLFLEFASEISNVITSSLGKDQNVNTIINDKIATQPLSSKMQTIQSDMISQIEQCIIATATHISSANQARKSNNTLIALFLDADMSILGRDADRYDRYAGSIRKEYEFVERSVYCEKRAEILESFLPVIDAVEAASESPDNDERNASTLESTRGKEKEKNHLYIYATEKGRELWEDRARKNLRREINMLCRGTIPCENQL